MTDPRDVRLTPAFAVQETEDAARAGWLEIQRLFDEYENLPDFSAAEIEPGSKFDVDNQVQDYDPAPDQMAFLLGVASDHLDTFHRMLKDEEGGLPAMSGYTILRAAIEAACTAIWLRRSNTANTRIMRSLWMIVHGRDDIANLATKLGLTNSAGYDRMRSRVDGIIASRRGLQPSGLDKMYTKTSIINDVDRLVPHRALKCLDAWQACSGITHANRSSAMMLLERSPLETVGAKTTYYVTASATVTAEVLFVAVSAFKTASEFYVDHAKGSATESFHRRRSAPPG